MNGKKMSVLTMTCGLMLLASCGTSKLAQNNASAGQKQNTETRVSDNQQSEAVKKLTFVQKVYDNQVYTKNIVGNASLEIKAAGKDISLPGALRMRKDEVIRLQLFIPLLGTEVGRLEFTPNYVLIIDRLHKEYIKADYNQVDFLKRQGINFYSLQALFWNQLLVPGNQKVAESDLKKFDANLAAEGDVVPVSLQNGNMSYQWNANRTNGRIGEAVVTYQTPKAGTSKLTIKYDKFKSVGVKSFPAKQSLTFFTTMGGKQQQAQLNVDMDNVKTDSNWDAKTEVSSKYKQVSPEDVLGKIMSM